MIGVTRLRGGKKVLSRMLGFYRKWKGSGGHPQLDQESQNFSYMPPLQTIEKERPDCQRLPDRRPLMAMMLQLPALELVK